MRAIGCDLAGMSTAPEVIAARHLGVRCLGISVVTNMAAGVVEGKLGEVLQVGAEAQPLADGAAPRAPALACVERRPDSRMRTATTRAISPRSTACSPTSASPAKAARRDRGSHRARAGAGGHPRGGATRSRSSTQSASSKVSAGHDCAAS